MGLIVCAVIAFTVLDGPLRWALLVGGLIYEVVETVLFVRWSQRRRPQTGLESLVGRRGIVATPVGPDHQGFVRIHAERWAASAAYSCAVGQEIEVVAAEGLHLVVRPVGDGTPGAPPEPHR